MRRFLLAASTLAALSSASAAPVDLAKLSRDGVEIFFTQVFRHGFFHGDMHPGNILVGDEGEDFNRYIALDFGIVGTLSEFDKNYLAQNFLAFFQRDYRRVAELHVESGWVPRNTRVEALEGAVRACCEPSSASRRASWICAFFCAISSHRRRCPRGLWTAAMRTPACCDSASSSSSSTAWLVISAAGTGTPR